MAQANGITTLLTDFGTTDAYVGVMKGVLLQINPHLTLVDLTHAIPAQQVDLAAWQLQTAYLHFPRGTVHLVVVDPGVGSDRRAIALETEAGFFVAPDNGVLSGIIAAYPATAIQAVTLTCPEYWYDLSPSHTFQGRDIFAAVAAHLASGVPLQSVGKPIPPESLVCLPLALPERLPNGIRGQVQAIDQFGNVITNIPGTEIVGKTWMVFARGHVFAEGITYSSVERGQPLSLIGSHGWLELAVNGGSASHRFGFQRQDPIEVYWGDTVDDDLP